MTNLPERARQLAREVDDVTSDKVVEYVEHALLQFGSEVAGYCIERAYGEAGRKAVASELRKAAETISTAGR